MIQNSLEVGDVPRVRKLQRVKGFEENPFCMWRDRRNVCPSPDDRKEDSHGTQEITRPRQARRCLDVDKHIGGRRICESTGAAHLKEAEHYLARLMEATRQAQVYGIRPSRSFEEAAAKFVLENQQQAQPG